MVRRVPVGGGSSPLLHRLLHRLLLGQLLTLAPLLSLVTVLVFFAGSPLTLRAESCTAEESFDVVGGVPSHRSGPELVSVEISGLSLRWEARPGVSLQWVEVLYAPHSSDPSTSPPAVLFAARGVPSGEIGIYPDSELNSVRVNALRECEGATSPTTTQAPPPEAKAPSSTDLACQEVAGIQVSPDDPLVLSSLGAFWELFSAFIARLLSIFVGR